MGPAEFGRFVQKLGLDEQKLFNLNAPAAILINHNSLRHNKLFEFDFFNLKTGDAIEVAFTPQAEGAQPTNQGIALAATTAELPLGISYPSTDTMLIVSDASSMGSPPGWDCRRTPAARSLSKEAIQKK